MVRPIRARWADGAGRSSGSATLSPRVGVGVSGSRRRRLPG